MQAIVSLLMYLGLVSSPNANVSVSSTSADTVSVTVDGTPVIIDIQEF